MEEVKKQLGSKNFYLYVYQQIKEGVRPSKICKQLDISKQKLNYYLATLKRSGFIQRVGYGVWEILKDFEVKEVKKITKVASDNYTLLENGKVRAHAFQFKIRIPKIRNWNNRDKILTENNINFQPLTIGGVNRGQKLEFKGRKIWLTKKSIIIYEKASYLGDTAKEGKSNAIYELVKLLRALELFLGADLKIKGQYNFKVSRQHYALVKNSLAKQYNEEGKKLEIYNNTGLWFVIDNSYNLNEAETQGTRAVTANEKVKTFFNEVEELEGYSPKVMVKAVAQNAENHAQYAENLKAHVASIKELGSAVTELTKIVKELKNENNN